MILAEAENLPSRKLITALRDKEEWSEIKTAPHPESDIKVFTKKEIKITAYKEEKLFSSYKIKMNRNKLILLQVVHLPSAMYKSEEARNSIAQNISDQLRKLEESVFGDSTYYSVVVGDFNLQPYSYGIAGAFAFNATMSEVKARKESRNVLGQKRLFYFNPMWDLMGKHGKVQGSYYYENDKDDKSLYWYSFDEVLIRPSLIDFFSWKYFDYISEVDGRSLLKNQKINKDDYSDHFPLKFEIMEDQYE